MVDRCGDPDTAAVTMNDALHRCKTDASAHEFLGVVQALESAEEFIGVSHIETGAVVPDEKAGFAVLVAHTEFNNCMFAFAAIFPRII